MEQKHSATKPETHRPLPGGSSDCDTFIDTHPRGRRAPSQKILQPVSQFRINFCTAESVPATDVPAKLTIPGEGSIRARSHDAERIEFTGKTSRVFVRNHASNDRIQGIKKLMFVGSLIVTISIMGPTQLNAQSGNFPLQTDSNVSPRVPSEVCESGHLMRTPCIEEASGQQITAELNRKDLSPRPSAATEDPDQLQSIQEQQKGNISGTVTDQGGDIIPGAVVILEDDVRSDRRTGIANDDGFFEFDQLMPGAYRLAISASGFAGWTSPVLRLESGQFLIVDKIALIVAGGPISITVTASPVEIATEQVRIAEHQRVLGFIPNFLVVYDRNPAPLTAKLKFRLAFRVAFDPVTLIGVAGMGAIDQAASTPNYVEGAKGYGQRVGALYADGFTDLMLGGAILPSLLHQDPRYFYQGTGTTKSRVRHALFSPFVCRGDNGRWQPNFSSLGGNLASTAISEAYYPSSNRGSGLVFGNFLIGTGERMVSALAQEFLLRRLTPSAAKNR